MTDSEENIESEFVDEEESEMGPALVKRLREKLKAATDKGQEYLDGWQRSRADFANFKREEALMHSDREARITTELVEALIPSLDTLELALKHAKEAEAKGLEMIYKQFLGSLKQIGVEKYGAVGETFNPHRYEALREAPTDDDSKDHTVESVERSGYAVGERVIRPAQVSVFAKK